MTGLIIIGIVAPVAEAVHEKRTKDTERLFFVTV
jgi:hypothetical protein